MPMGTRLTYSTLTLSSTELIKVSYRRQFKVEQQSTVAQLQLTQPGNLTAPDITVTAIIRDNASTKFNAWTAKLAEKPWEGLTLLNRNWGNCFLTSVDITTEELDEVGDILRFEMSLDFVVNQNFV